MQPGAGSASENNALSSALDHARRIVSEATDKPERVAVMELRGQLTKYDLDQPRSVAVRNQLIHIESLHDIETILGRLIQAEPEFAL